jgi:hypothetical protein
MHKINESKVLKSKPKTYSVSRLKTFERCSYEYYHKYVLETPMERKHTLSTLLGGLIHESLEFLHTTDREDIIKLIDAFHVIVLDYLIKNKVMGNVSREEAEGVVSLLESYSKDIALLYERASENYRGADAIRVKGGGIASNPTMTTGWKNAEIELDLPNRRTIIENFLADKGSDEYSHLVPQLYADAYTMCTAYKTPTEIREIVALEMPISHWSKEEMKLINPVKMPATYGGKKSIYLNGYVDLIAKVEVDGHTGIAIIDYKTDKAAYTQDEVSCNRQLMTYVYAYEILTEQQVDYIGINNIRNNKLVLSKIDREKMEVALGSLFSAHLLIDKGHFIKKTPDSAYSPCKDCYGKACPFLEFCWPHTYEILNS